MRLNIYAEELTTEATLVQKTADTGITFYGLRLYLKSPEELHHSETDDDRSAITLWVPWTKEGGHAFHIAEEALDKLKLALYNARIEQEAIEREAWLRERQNTPT